LFFFFSASANLSYIIWASYYCLILNYDTLFLNSEFSRLSLDYRSVRIVDCIMLDDRHLLSSVANDSLNYCYSSISRVKRFDLILSLFLVYLTNAFYFSISSLSCLCISDLVLCSCFLSYSCIRYKASFISILAYALTFWIVSFFFSIIVRNFSFLCFISFC
jgi:hypothetical protein